MIYWWGVILDNKFRSWSLCLRHMIFISVTLLSAGCGVESGNEFLELPENITDSDILASSSAYEPLGEIPDKTLADVSVRGRPYIDDSLGYNVIRSDIGTALRGVSLSFDGGDPYGSLPANLPSGEQLDRMVHEYGFNTLHVYLEGDASENPHPVGLNEALADQLVARTREAKMYLIITVGNNGENGQIHSMDKTLEFWNLYGSKYRDETHVIYEAHNEPVAGINGNWTQEDWDKQALMYRTIRGVAPDTMVLLGSFMSFFGGKQAIAGADGLAAEFPGIWDNAGFAFHAYWDIAEVENTIRALETSIDYPALLCTEFFPGDTKNDFNEIFESHHIGWTQFEWLAANDLELDRFKGYLDIAGTVWRPDSASATWPASGSPYVPFDQKIGLYSRADEAFLRLDDSFRVIADDRSYDGIGGDEFTVIDAGSDGSIALRGDNGLYLTVSNEGESIVASAQKIGDQQKFQWLELPTGDIALRPWSGSAHLVGTLPASGGGEYGLTGPVGVGVERNGANTYRVAESYTSSIAPLPPLPEIPPGPFFGSPMPVPTDGDAAHPLDSLAPSGRLWASDYDYGGEGVAYHDTGKINLGEAYRANEAVDVESSSEGYTSVGFFEEDEWLEYSIDVESAGNYTITMRTASIGGGYISFESNCVKLTENLSTPNTGGWDTFQDSEVEVTLTAGEQKLRVVSGGNMNLMNLDIREGGSGGSNYGVGCLWTPPPPDDVFVEAESWTNVIAEPDGAVAIAPSTDSDLSNYVGNFDAGDFIEYGVSVPRTGCYKAEYRIASAPGSNGFELTFGDNLVDSFSVMPTGGWSSWVTFNSFVELAAGSQTMRLEAVGASFNLNWLKFNQADASACEDDGSIIIEAESFSRSIQPPDGEVGTQPTSDDGGGLNVGWIDAGDWVEYVLSVPVDGNYSLTYRVASQGGSSQGLNLSVDGALIDAVAVQNTGTWQKWETLEGGVVSLVSGEHVLRVDAPAGGFNLNWIKLTPTTESPVGNIGTGSDNVLDVGESISFDNPLVDYGLFDVSGNVSSLGTDPVDGENTVVAVINGMDPASGTIVAQEVVVYPLGDKLTRLSMRLYSPSSGIPVRVSLADTNNSSHRVVAEVLMTTVNSWETVVFDFADLPEGTSNLDSSHTYDSLSIFFNFGTSDGNATFYLDDIKVLEEYIPPATMTAEMLVGDWVLVPEYGAFGVGPTPGSTSNWVSDEDAVNTRSCLFDDVYRFDFDGTFQNILGDQTWLETWQGVSSESCGVPVSPHDGLTSASYSYDFDAKMITINGIGAYLGIPKVINDAAELSDPESAPESISYKVVANTQDRMTLEVSYTGGYWTFKFIRKDALNSETPPATDGRLSMPSLATDGMLEARATAKDLTPGSANGISNAAVGSSLSFHGDNISGNDSWRLNIGEWYGGSDGNYGMTVGMMVFQMPNFGMIDEPFSSAEYEVTLDIKGDAVDFSADLWAVRVSDEPDLQLSDWYVGSATTAPQAAGTLIAEGFLTPQTELGVTVTSEEANSELVAFLNTQYEGGNGAGKYLFFRLNRGGVDEFVEGWNAYVVKSSQADEGSDVSPKIKFTSFIEPLPINTEEPSLDTTCNLPDGNLISNGGFANAEGWTVINHYEAENTMGSVSIANGAATFAETDTAEAGQWKHLGIYTEVELCPGTYRFDMSMIYIGISDAWGEVYLGSSEPVSGREYNGDKQVLKAFNSWECSSSTTYRGNASASGCDTASVPGRFEIAKQGRYYILFRSGGASYGSSGVVIDDWSLTKE